MGILKKQLIKVQRMYNQKHFFSFLEDSMKMTKKCLTHESELNYLISEYYRNGLNNHIIELGDITLFSNPYNKYASKKMEDNNMLFQSDTIKELLSYSIGCMMGRYSLDREGLVYAHEGNKGFTELVVEGTYKTFPADNDGILPLMDDEWFDDDVTSRGQRVCPVPSGDEEHLHENLEFIAESLCLYAIKPEKRRICAGYHSSLSFHPILERFI
ncbi:Uncharacterised protein [Klebsiella michiganensis]|uniref:Uncharacterized protein n=1 Tax=Klebsiella michiganensis TaxID=1134687 RepID=A0A7H4PQD7_9ENTR|nr:Uncharacterised protein [Klebsiella michiganensis]